ncbi:hypothetical protein VZ95_02285 [Elstera litoralis]|uniref:Uncharacterized protein n=1 Tax=Elstera litoralis TaxID=552518 RepID=A0A0F3IVS1_9PROT|nr:hypothetical protein [Elstera litoralis]KJV10850.1 hypothetical protein VZ95_02285 [Elstera litoralis]
MIPHPFLRCALLLDALASGAMGLLLLLAGRWLHPWLGLPEPLMVWGGLALLPYALLLIFLARRPAVRRAAIHAVIGANLVWVGDSVVLLLSGWVTPTLLGEGFVLAQAAAVAVFAGLQTVGLRRSLAARRALVSA